MPKKQALFGEMHVSSNKSQKPILWNIPASWSTFLTNIKRVLSIMCNNIISQNLIIVFSKDRQHSDTNVQYSAKFGIVFQKTAIGGSAHWKEGNDLKLHEYKFLARKFQKLQFFVPNKEKILKNLALSWKSMILKSKKLENENVEENSQIKMQ